MKVLLLIHGMDTTDGGARNAATMVATLTALRHSVVVHEYKTGFWQYVREARSRAQQSDVVQAVDINPLGFAGYLATRLTRAKLVIVAQAAYAITPLYNTKTAFFSQLVYRAADAVVAGSTYVAVEIQKKVPGLQIAVIDPGIDLSKFAGTTTGARARAAEPPYLLGVGAVKTRKGYEIALRAFALAKKDIPALQYRVVGSQKDEPGYFKQLTELAHELGVAHDVEFLARVSDATLNELYAHASIFILTSINQGFHLEGFGMVFLEAEAHGIPCIGTSGNGIADAMENGATGILVPQNDAQAAADAIKKILDDSALAAKMSARAYTFAREHDTEHLMRRWAELYKSLCISTK